MNIINLVNALPWNPNRRWSTRPQSNINKIILHQELAEGTIEQVNNYHINPNHISDRGCPHFCYHYGIRKNGEVIQANELTHVTWHTKGQNSVSVGIMLEGNFKGTGHDLGKDKPTDEQMKSVEEIVEHLKDLLNLTNQDVYGHYHYGKPACPGYFVSDWIEKHRKDGAETVTGERLQEMLNSLGYDCGPVDGVIGRKTTKAIRDFQKDQGLTVDGIPGSQTILKLVSLT
jgi:N-acetyl-anhydromuramyl-L-alanine amidase AmpD